MSFEAWDALAAGDVVTVRNRFLDLPRTVTVGVVAPEMGGFLDDRLHLFTPTDYELTPGAGPSVEQTAATFLRNLYPALFKSHRHRHVRSPDVPVFSREVGASLSLVRGGVPKYCPSSYLNEGH